LPSVDSPPAQRRRTLLDVAVISAGLSFECTVKRWRVLALPRPDSVKYVHSHLDFSESAVAGELPPVLRAGLYSFGSSDQNSTAKLALAHVGLGKGWVETPFTASGLQDFNCTRDRRPFVGARRRDV
jgi:hypothetical protein